MSDLPLVVIVGAGRSGTSLLHSMVATHPLVVGLPESGLLRRYILLGLLEHLSGKGVNLSERMSLDNRLKRLEIDWTTCLDQAKKSSDGLDRNVYESVARLAMERDGASMVLDKDPRLVEHLEKLWMFFPNTRVVHVFRDPRAVFNSRLQAEWGASATRLKHAIAQTHQAQKGFSMAAENPEKMISVCYEDLLENPEEVLGTICQFLGLPFDTGMLQYQKVSQRLVSPEELSWKKETMGPLLQGNSTKWETQLPPREIAIIESVYPQAFNTGHYDRRSPQLPFGDRVQVGILGPLGRLAAAILRSGFLRTNRFGGN